MTMGNLSDSAACAAPAATNMAVAQTPIVSCLDFIDPPSPTCFAGSLYCPAIGSRTRKLSRQDREGQNDLDLRRVLVFLGGLGVLGDRFSVSESGSAATAGGAVCRRRWISSRSTAICSGASTPSSTRLGVMASTVTRTCPAMTMVWLRRLERTSMRDLLVLPFWEQRR